MKIAFVANPASLHIARWIREFESRGMECRLFAPASTGEKRFIDAIDVGRQGWTGVASTIMRVADLQEKLARFQPDIIHAHFALGYGTWAALSGTRPLVITCMGTDLLVAPAQSLSSRWKVSAALSSADLVTVNAEHLGAAAIRLGAHPARVVRVVQGVDSELLMSLDRSSRSTDPILLSTRMLLPVYHLDDVLRAAALLVGRGLRVRLHRAGSGPMEGELRSLRRRLRLEDRVDFLGFLSGDEALAAAYQKADIGMSVSASDGASVAVLEAMSCGLPMVVSDIPANREWMTPGSGNFLVPVGNVEAIATALETLIGDRKLRARAGAANRLIVQRRATWKTEMDRMENHYHNLVARYRGA